MPSTPDKRKKIFFAMEEMRVKVQRRVVNARDGSRAAIRPDRVKDGVAVVVRVWEQFIAERKRWSGCPCVSFKKSGRNQAQEVQSQVTIGSSHEVA